ncbi:MAG: hypothetical protein HKN26_09820 [Acidimicrobiales bacterium]|nr:hypothetical protein [Acidimicrobiales bacterium]
MGEDRTRAEVIVLVGFVITALAAASIVAIAMLGDEDETPRSALAEPDPDNADQLGAVFTQGAWTSIEIPFAATDIIATDTQLLAVGGADFDMMMFEGGVARGEFFQSDDGGLTWDQADDPPAGANTLIEYAGEVLAGTTSLLAEPGVAVLGRWTGDRWEEIELPVQALDGDRNVLRLQNAQVSVLPLDDVLVTVVVQTYNVNLESLVPREFENSDYSIIPTPAGMNIFDASVVGQQCVLPMLMEVMRDGDQSEEIRSQGCDPDLPPPELVRSITAADAGFEDLLAFGSVVDVFTSVDGVTFTAVDLPAELASGPPADPFAVVRNGEVVVNLPGGTWTSVDGRSWKPSAEQHRAGDSGNGRLAIDWNGGPFLSMPDHPEVEPVLAGELLNRPRDHHIEFWGEPPGSAGVIGAIESWNKGDQWLTQLHLIFAEDGRWLVESDPRLLGTDSLLTAASQHGDQYLLGLVDNPGFFGEPFNADPPSARLLIGRPAG